MTPEAIETAQEESFQKDYQRLGPSIYRALETWLLGYIALKNSSNALLRKKADRFAFEIRRAYPVFLAGRLFGPNRTIRLWIADVENQVHAELGQPAMFQRLESVAAVFLAVWSWAKLQLDLFQHPSLIRHTFRLPEESVPAKLWRRLRGEDPSGHNVQVELRPEQTIWVRIEGRLAMAGADRLGQDLKNALARRRERLVLDLNHLKASEHEALERLGRTLAQYKHRIRVVLPADRDFSAFAALNALQIQCVFSMATTPS